MGIALALELQSVSNISEKYCKWQALFKLGFLLSLKKFFSNMNIEK